MVEFWIASLALAGLFGLSHTAYAVTLTSVLAFGTIGFWVLAVIASILLFAFIEAEEGSAATITLLLFLAIQQFFGFNVISYLVESPMRTLYLIGGYFVGGTIWSFIKWWFYVKDVRYRYDEAREEKAPSMSKKEWAYYVANYGLSKPIASKSKEKILRWMSFWPWSLIWTLINDPVKKAFRAIYQRIQGLLQSIADSAFEGTEGDFK